MSVDERAERSDALFDSKSVLRRSRVAWASSPWRRVVRNRWCRAGLLIALALLAARMLQQRVDALAEARDAWLDQVEVAVVIEPIAAGSSVGDGIEMRSLPVAVVPDTALRERPSGLARVDLVVGEVLVQSRLIAEGQAAVAGGPAGSVAVSVIAPDSPGSVGVGALVDVWSTDAANLSAHRAVATAVVVDRDDDVVTLAVAAEQVSEIVVARLRPVTLVVVG